MSKFPEADESGALFRHIGHRHSILVDYAIEHIGDEAGLTPWEYYAAWARKNDTVFFTKVVPKYVPKQIDVQATLTIEDLLTQVWDPDTNPQQIDGQALLVDEEA